MKKLLFIIPFLFIICACTKTQPEFLPETLKEPLEESSSQSLEELL